MFTFPGCSARMHLRVQNSAVRIEKHPYTISPQNRQSSRENALNFCLDSELTDLHCHRTLPASEQEPGLAGVLRRFADFGQVPW